MRILLAAICCVVGVVLLMDGNVGVGIVLLVIGIVIFAGKGKNQGSVSEGISNAIDRREIKKAIRREEQAITNIKARNLLGVGDGLDGRMDRLELSHHEENIRNLKLQLRHMK